MKVILLMAMSANGMIARENGSEDFLSHENWKTFLQFVKKYKCVVWGRKTYESVKKWDLKYINSLKKAKIFVVTSGKTDINSNCILAQSPQDAIKKASSFGFKSVLLSGGSSLNSSFIKENLIDEIILNIEPFALGKGITLFKDDDFESKLKLVKTKKLPKGIIQLHYKIV
ncbi:MAG TPA: dihydrofolate reductase [archaeon]|nr:dihydrofolate reductase [archaeon]